MPWNPSRLPQALAALVLLVITPIVALDRANADLIGSLEGAQTLTADQMAILDKNPDLEALEGDNPDIVRAVLGKLTALRAERSGADETISRGSLDTLTVDDVQLLGRNPALLEIWRAAPEAAVDLLALIRAAAGKGGRK
jgi:hypothetical protein